MLGHDIGVYCFWLWILVALALFVSFQWFLNLRPLWSRESRPFPAESSFQKSAAGFEEFRVRVYVARSYFSCNAWWPGAVLRIDREKLVITAGSSVYVLRPGEVRCFLKGVSFSGWIVQLVHEVPTQPKFMMLNGTYQEVRQIGVALAAYRYSVGAGARWPKV